MSHAGLWVPTIIWCIFWALVLSAPTPKPLRRRYVSAKTLFKLWFKEEVMPNLYPDMSRDQYEDSDDFVYAAPIPEEHWLKLAANSMGTPSGARFFVDPAAKVAILLRERYHSDDDMLEAGAFVRITLDCRHRMYAAPSCKNMDLSDVVLKTIGAPRRLAVMYDLPKQLGDEEDVS